jgi:hypothetical protein
MEMISLDDLRLFDIDDAKSRSRASAASRRNVRPYRFVAR